MTFRFNPRGNLIIVPVRLYSRNNSEIADLALDTGATRTVISREIALYLGYELTTLQKRARIVTGSGAVSVPLLSVASIYALGKVRNRLFHSLPYTTAISG